MANPMQDIMFQAPLVTVRIRLLELWRVLEARERAGQHDEPCQQDPGADGGEDIMEARDLVQLEEHVHVAGGGRTDEFRLRRFDR